MNKIIINPATKDSSSPCKDCESREVGCHSACSIYIDWANEIKEFSEDINKKKKNKNSYIPIEARPARFRGDSKVKSL